MDTVGRILQDERCRSSQLTVGLVHGGMETYLGSLTELKGTRTLDVITSGTCLIRAGYFLLGMLCLLRADGCGFALGWKSLTPWKNMWLLLRAGSFPPFSSWL